MKNDNKIEFNNLVLKPLPSLSSLFNNLITYLKHMIMKTMKMLQGANIMTYKKSSQWKFLIKTVACLYFALILAL